MGERGSQEGRSVGTWVGGCQGREGPGMAVVNGDRVLWLDGNDGSTET